jgi:hypothetical protein
MTRRSLASLFALPGAFAQSQPADAYTTFDSDGTAHIKRRPGSENHSPEAQALMISGRWMPPSHRRSHVLQGEDERLSGGGRGNHFRGSQGLIRYSEASRSE